MNWIISILLSLPLVGLGLTCGYYIGDQCVRWYRISSFEGGSGYFVVGLALLGGVIGLTAGLVVPGIVGPQNAAAHARSFGIAAGVVLGLAAIALGLCRVGADLPPTMDGLPLTLEVEIKLPVGADSPVGMVEGSSLELHSVVNAVARKSENGSLSPEQARLEDGRWIVPGSVSLFTKRGKRSIAYSLGGEEAVGFLIPIPGRPGRSFLEWSEWGPRPPASYPAWPDTKASYRFRVRQIEPEQKEPALSYEDVEEGREAEKQALFDAIALDAPLAERLAHMRYETRVERRKASARIVAEKPNFLEEAKGFLTGADAELAAETLRLIELLPEPNRELVGLVEGFGRDIAERIRRFNATKPEEDPSYEGAAAVSVRFSAWMVAVRSLRSCCGGDFTPELGAILELSRERPDSHAMRQDVCRVASYYMSEWAGLAPLDTDPKPR